jgi:peptidyl-prolyl cis-trans isomerase C
MKEFKTTVWNRVGILRAFLGHFTAPRICPAAMAAALALLPASAAESPQSTSTASSKASMKMEDLFPDHVIARGKGFEIKRSQLDERVIELKSSNLARGAPLSPEVEAQVLQKLIGIALLSSKATDADKTKSQELTQKRIDAAKKSAGSDESFQRQLKSVGISEDQFRKQVMEETLAETVAERELNVNISDEDVKKFYDENPARFDLPETVRVMHIQMNSRDPGTGEELSEEKKAAKRKKMEELLKRARAGEDFATLAKENTEDPNFKETGGEYKFARSQPGAPTGIPTEFEIAAFNLNTNEVSDVVTTQYGYHIIKLLEKLPARKLELAKITPDLRDFLKQREMQKRFPDYIEKEKKDAKVEILEEKLKPRERSDAVPPGAPAPAKTGGK